MAPRFLAASWMVALCSMSVSGQERSQISTESTSVIEWSADRALTVNDFKAKVPARAGSASLSWVAIEASWECEDGMGSWRARAVFDPNRSWWREINQNIWPGSDPPPLLAPKNDGGRGLLAHEQLHFDLTEIWARKIRELFTTLTAACKTPGASHTFEAPVDRMQHAWLDEQQRYDTETSHGTDADRQKAWATRAAKALKQSYAAPATDAER